MKGVLLVPISGRNMHPPFQSLLSPTAGRKCGQTGQNHNLQNRKNSEKRDKITVILILHVERTNSKGSGNGEVATEHCECECSSRPP
jgi:hypothetical protein